MKRIWSITLVLAMALLLLAGCSGEKQPTATATLDPATKIVVSVRTLEKELYHFELARAEGDTALSVLQRGAKDANIAVALTGSDDMAYVSGIGGLKEKDQGDKSGWVFRVNEQFGMTSAGATVLKDGDKVEFLYSLDWGADWGMSY